MVPEPLLACLAFGLQLMQCEATPSNLRGGMDANTLAVVDQLNSDYMDEPLAPGGSLGVHMVMMDKFAFFCDTKCNNGTAHSDTPNTENFGIWSDCRQSSMLINRAYTRDIHIYYGSGYIYHRSVLEKAVRCSYAQDSGSRFRVNHGCGCDFYSCKLPEFASMQKPCSQYVNRSLENPCNNIDAATGQKNMPASPLVSMCQCQDVEEPLSGKTGTCYWQGPAFFEGQGKNQIREMVEQRLLHPKEWIGSDEHPDGLNTEVIVDESILQEMLRNDFAGTIAAFFVVENMTSTQQVRQYLEAGPMKQYSLEQLPPIIGFDPKRPNGPFYVTA